MVQINHKGNGLRQRTAFHYCNTMSAASHIKIDPALYRHPGQIAVTVNRKKRKSFQYSFCIKCYTGIRFNLMRLNRYILYQRNQPSLYFQKSSSDKKGKCASFSDKMGCPICSNGHLTASCGSFQRTPPSDSGSNWSPQR